MPTELHASRRCDYCDSPSPTPAYFKVGPPGAPLLLWTGQVSRADGHPARTGQVSLVWRRKFGLDFALDPDTSGSPSWQWIDFDKHPVELGFEFAGTVSSLRVVYRDDDHGVLLSGGTLGNQDAALSKVVAHLGNMPRIHGTSFLHDPETHAAWSGGRWEVDTNDWHITIDQVSHFEEDFNRAKLDESYAITHTLRLTRRDNATFSPAEGDNVLAAVLHALSFAAGFWVSMICPVGFDASETPVWLNLRAPHAGHAQTGSGWWSYARPEDLGEIIRAVVKQWRFPKANDPTRFAITSAILASATGFVEQRLVTAFAALEHASWTMEVLDRGLNDARWFGLSGKRRVRRLLIALDVDPAFNSTVNSRRLSDYGRSLGYHDLAETVVQVRNTVAHPKPGHDLYAHEGVLLDALHHVHFWLELAILCRLNYTGEVSNRTLPMRYGGISESVPWTRGTSPAA